MRQRNKFDMCTQDRLSVLDYLRKLQEIADTIGDMDDRDVVLAFWRRCQPYLRVEMTKDGLDPTTLSLAALEESAVRYERAHLMANEEGKRGRTSCSSRFNQPRRDTGNSIASSSSGQSSSLPATGKSDRKDNKWNFAAKKGGNQDCRDNQSMENGFGRKSTSYSLCSRPSDL